MLAILFIVLPLMGQFTFYKVAKQIRLKKFKPARSILLSRLMANSSYASTLKFLSLT
jgi:hypothetical protein